jgi:D-glycero-D-manno-heptose 1,7-bisphosphate phosphatase
MKGGTPRRDTVILDRDGTIVVDRHYLDDPDGLCFLPGAADGLRWLTAHGYRLVVVTNQSGIGRGLLSVERLHQIHERLNHMILQVGARLDGIYFCPHLPDDNCECRKPRTGLLTRAADELGFDMSSVIVIGDKDSDIDLGRRVSAPTILVGEPEVPARSATAPDFTARDLIQAAETVALINAK